MKLTLHPAGILLGALLLGTLLINAKPSFAHAGHDDAFGHGPSSSAEDGAVTVTPDGQQTIGLSTQPVGKAVINESLQVTGRVEVAEDLNYDINPLVSGVVKQVLVKVTDNVSVGTPLAVIQSMEVANALSALLEQRSQLQAEIDAAVTEMNLAERTSSRQRMLYKEGITAEKNYLAAKSAYDVAAVRVRSARERLKLATEAARSSTRIMGLQDSAFERVIATGQVTADVSLLSPVAGSVTFRDMTPGESVDTKKRVFTILDLSQVWVVVDVFQEKTGKVVIGQEVVISTASGQQLAGTVSSIGSIVEATKRTLPVRIVVNNKDGTLKPGTFVTGEIAIAIGQKPSLIVPSAALIEEGGRTLVFVKRGTLFVSVDVVPGARSSGMVAVSGKIAEGELVVVNGARQLYAQTLINSRQGHKPGEGDLNSEASDAEHGHGDAKHEHGDAKHEHGDHEHGETAHHDHSQHAHAPDAHSARSKFVGLIVEQLPGIGMGVALSLLFALVWSLLKKHGR